MKEDYPGQFAGFIASNQEFLRQELEFIRARLMDKTLQEIRALPEMTE